MLNLVSRRKLKNELKKAVMELEPLTSKPLEELYDGQLLNHSVLLSEEGLVVYVDNTPNRLGDRLLRSSIWLEITQCSEGLEIHLWNGEGIIIPRPLLLTPLQVLGNAKKILSDCAGEEGGIRCMICFNRSDGYRSLSAFSSTTEAKYMICELLGISHPGEAPVRSVTHNKVPER